MFVIQFDLRGQKINFKVRFLKILFLIIKIAANVIHNFYVILNRESICGGSFGDSNDILISKSKFQVQNLGSMIFDD